MNFASDNWAGAHPAITEALRLNGNGRATAYGKSDIDRRIESVFSQVFEKEVAVFFVATGTAANALSMALLNRPGGIIFAHRNAHMIEDECGAVEYLATGARIYGVPGTHGKMDPEALNYAINRYHGDVHHGRPMAISLTQSTESGTVYSLEHIDAICRVAQTHGLQVHMDGARFANALVSLQCTPAEMTWKRGVNVLSFGATKNGCWCAEAIIVFDGVEKALKEMPFLRKRAAHLFSKTRFIAAQFVAYFHDDLWLENARTANRMASKLCANIQNYEKACWKKLHGKGHMALPRLAWPVESNELFVVMEKRRANELQGSSGIIFYEWIVPDLPMNEHCFSIDEANGEGLFRLVTSWSTTEEEVDMFSSILLPAASN